MSRYVERYNTAQRVLHWSVAVSFFVLVFSGLGLYAHTFFRYFDFFGGPQQGIFFHKTAAIIFFVCASLLFLSNRKETTVFDADDLRWFRHLGGYLKRGGEELPQGKYNAGQKVFAIFAFVATLFMGLSGMIIWDPVNFARGLTRFALMLHGLIFTLFMMGVVVHIYLGTIGNPGTLEGMLWGRVKKVWARKHAIKWYRKVTGE